jgi:hypothetical protein
VKTRNLLLGILLLLGAVALAWWGLREAPPAEQPPLPFEVPGASGGAGDCYFNWATQQLPELSAQVQDAMQEVQPGAQARAEAYGENCIYADGHADFSAMETDYVFILRAKNIDDPEELGGLIRKSMDLLAARFPTGQTPGPQPGQVTFRFQSAGGEKNLPVQVLSFQNMPRELTGRELFNILFPPP